LIATFLGVAGVLAAWTLILWGVRAREGRPFRVEPGIVRAHWVQGLVQSSIYVYWGWYSRGVYAESPLIVAQIVFFYVFTSLLAFSRGKTWKLGFGPLPIVLSTNLLLWFKADWFYFQFLMLATGALGKEFITWTRDGRRTHIFNPSVFGQAIVALILIFTGATRTFTMGEEIATSFESLPHIFLLLFALGLIVQYMFAVTLMTFAATATLCLLNLIYSGVTDTYYFVGLNVGATIFLGLHLLVTDPATSPKTNTGRVIFGALYGLGYAVLFRLFDGLGVSVFWDKLLPVPILNLAVPLIDRFARSGIVGRLNRAWETALQPRRLNLVHMGVWAVVFATMVGTGFVMGEHEGRSISYWRKKYTEGNERAGEVLMQLCLHRAAHDDPEAMNMLGMIHREGDLVAKNDAAAAAYFAKACELGDPIACENVVGQFLFERRANTREDVLRALDHLEARCASSADGFASFLVAFAYETGSERPRDIARARELYDDACGKGNEQACERARELERLAGTGSGGIDANEAEEARIRALMEAASKRAKGPEARGE
jgi:TPR repeat protein